MNILKGYTEEEIFALASGAEKAEKDNVKMTEVFKSVAEKYGRAQGSVRNFYYEFLKLCENDEALKTKYFKSVPTVKKPVPFDDDTTRELLRKILIGKKLNKSVRRSISELANGEEKLALRYQNKYRNVLKTNPALVEKTAEELGIEDDNIISGKSIKVPDFTLKLLKQSIDGLVEGIKIKSKLECERLKKLCDKLLKENSALKELVSRQAKEIEDFSKIKINDFQKEKEPC